MFLIVELFVPDSGRCYGCGRMRCYVQNSGRFCMFLIVGVLLFPTDVMFLSEIDVMFLTVDYVHDI